MLFSKYSKWHIAIDDSMRRYCVTSSQNPNSRSSFINIASWVFFLPLFKFLIGTHRDRLSLFSTEISELVKHMSLCVQCFHISVYLNGSCFLRRWGIETLSSFSGFPVEILWDVTQILSPSIIIFSSFFYRINSSLKFTVFS